MVGMEGKRKKENHVICSVTSSVQDSVSCVHWELRISSKGGGGVELRFLPWSKDISSEGCVWPTVVVLRATTQSCRGVVLKNEPFADAGGVLRHLSVAVVEHDGSSGYRVSIFAMCKAPDWSWDHLSRCTKLMDSSMLGVGVEACGFAVLTQ